MKTLNSYITVQNKKYPYILEKRKNGVIFVECKDANIAQEFLAEDVAELLIDLPNLIVSEKEYHKDRTEVVRFRVSSKDKREIEKTALKKGYSSVSEYIRDTVMA